MDSLPLEIVCEIVNILSCDPPGHLQFYATISKVWQDAVERQTFQSLEFNMTEVQTFHEMFESHRIYRARFLLKLTVELGNRSNAKNPGRNETVEASIAVSSLINVLADITSRANDAPPLTLSFTDCARWNDSFGVSDIILPDSDPCLHAVDRLKAWPTNTWKTRAMFVVACKLKGLRDAELVLNDSIEFGRRKRSSLRKGKLPVRFGCRMR